LSQAAATIDSVVGPLAGLGGLEVQDSGATRGAVTVRILEETLEAAARALAGTPGVRLADMFAANDSPATTLRLVWAHDRGYLVTETETEGSQYPPLSGIVPAAFVEECEIYEQFGIGPAAGEPLNRVMLPPHAAADFPRLGHRPPQPLDGVHARHTVEGQAFEFPFGPVRQVGMESLYYGLVTSGEEVVDLYLFTWHKHRGVEWRLRGPERSRSSWNGCTTMPRPWRRCARPLGCRWARPPPRSRWNGCCESTPLRSATGICSASSPLVE
jgi:Ni,Fe-hydrogenase III component G